MAWDIFGSIPTFLTGTTVFDIIASMGAGGGAIHFLGIDIGFGILIGIGIFTVFWIIRSSKKKRRYKR